MAERTLEEREMYLAKRKESYAINKEKIAVQNRIRYIKNPDRFKEIRNRTKAKNKEKIRIKDMEYNIRTKEIRAIKSKEKRNQNLEEFNRRARERRANRTPEQKARASATKKKYDEVNRKSLSLKRKEKAEQRRKRKNQWHKIKYRTDIKYKITHNLRSRIKTVIKGVAKADTSLRLIGCTTEEFKHYIESLFTEGMTWGLFMNGDIHIDHIKPCSKFDLTNPEEQKKCFHYLNLQPLWALDNLRKHVKYEEKYA